MRLLIMIAIGTAALEGTALAQVMASRGFAPPTAAEQAQLDRVTPELLPNSVRRGPTPPAASRVLWTGVTAGVEGGAAMVEHHYFDGVVEHGGGVWLSPWGEGRFCLLGLPADFTTKFGDEAPHFVRAYGHPVMTDRGLCLRDVFLVVGDLRWTTTMLDYGPGGRPDFSAADAAARGATHSHPESRLLTPVGYRVLAGAQVGKTNFDESAAGVGWSAALELSLRLSLRAELALMGGPSAYPRFAAPTSFQTALLFRYFTVVPGIAFGPLLSLPIDDAEKVFVGLRYLPTFGDAHGTWGLSPAFGGGMDVSASPDGDVRFMLQLVLGIRNAPRRARAPLHRRSYRLWQVAEWVVDAALELMSFSEAARCFDRPTIGIGALGAGSVSLSALARLLGPSVWGARPDDGAPSRDGPPRPRRRPGRAPGGPPGRRGAGPTPTLAQLVWEGPSAPVGKGRPPRAGAPAPCRGGGRGGGRRRRRL